MFSTALFTLSICIIYTLEENLWEAKVNFNLGKIQMKSGPESEKYQEVPNAQLPAYFFLIQKK